jgi:hypothetical protein
MPHHRHIDQRSLAFGRAIAGRLTGHPEYIERARTTLLRWMSTSAPAVRPALQEWLSVLEGSQDELIAILTGTDERSVRLRQSNPFTGVLPEPERIRIIRQFCSHDSAST